MAGFVVALQNMESSTIWRWVMDYICNSIYGQVSASLLYIKMFLHFGMVSKALKKSDRNLIFKLPKNQLMMDRAFALRKLKRH